MIIVLRRIREIKELDRGIHGAKPGNGKLRTVHVINPKIRDIRNTRFRIRTSSNLVNHRLDLVNSIMST